MLREPQTDVVIITGIPTLRFGFTMQCNAVKCLSLLKSQVGKWPLSLYPVMQKVLLKMKSCDRATYHRHTAGWPFSPNWCETTDGNEGKHVGRSHLPPAWPLGSPPQPRCLPHHLTPLKWNPSEVCARLTVIYLLADESIQRTWPTHSITSARKLITASPQWWQDGYTNPTLGRHICIKKGQLLDVGLWPQPSIT